MIQDIIDYCESKYKFFGKGLINSFYFFTVVNLRQMQLIRGMI